MFPVPTLKLPFYAKPFLWLVIGIDYLVSKVSRTRNEAKGPQGG